MHVVATAHHYGDEKVNKKCGLCGLFCGVAIFINMVIKQKRPQSDTTCFNCGIIFLKDDSEIKRSGKLGRENFCSRKCSANTHITNLGDFVGNPDNGKHLKGYTNNRSDKYTVIREHLNRAKKRDKEFDITLDDLLNLWDSQGGICSYTGIQLVPPREGKDVPMYRKASLDRIDSTIGYIVGNIQFISASANHAKNNMTHEEMVEFCRLITTHHL